MPRKSFWLCVLQLHRQSMETTLLFLVAIWVWVHIHKIKNVDTLSIVIPRLQHVPSFDEAYLKSGIDLLLRGFTVNHHLSTLPLAIIYLNLLSSIPSYRFNGLKSLSALFMARVFLFPTSIPIATSTGCTSEPLDSSSSRPSRTSDIFWEKDQKELTVPLIGHLKHVNFLHILQGSGWGGF